MGVLFGSQLDSQLAVFCLHFFVQFLFCFLLCFCWCRFFCFCCVFFIVVFVAGWDWAAVCLHVTRALFVGRPKRPLLKVTQGSFVVQQFPGMAHIESGALFREHISKGTPLGQQAKVCCPSGT